MKPVRFFISAAAILSLLCFSGCHAKAAETTPAALQSEAQIEYISESESSSEEPAVSAGISSSRNHDTVEAGNIPEASLADETAAENSAVASDQTSAVEELPAAVNNTAPVSSDTSETPTAENSDTDSNSVSTDPQNSDSTHSADSDSQESSSKSNADEDSSNTPESPSDSENETPDQPDAGSENTDPVSDSCEHEYDYQAETYEIPFRNPNDMNTFILTEADLTTYSDSSFINYKDEETVGALYFHLYFGCKYTCTKCGHEIMRSLGYKIANYDEWWNYASVYNGDIQS